MAKSTGLGDQLYVDGIDLSGDVGSLSGIGGGPAALDVTGIDKSGFERIGGLRDGAIEFSAFFNPARAHLKLNDLPTGDVQVMYCRGTTLGNPAAAMVAKQVNYDGTRGDDGAFTFKVTAQANGDGLEWGRLLTAGKRSDSSGTNGSSVDFGAAGSNGLQAYLQVFAFTGTSVTVKLQSSSDDGAGDAFADVSGGAFLAATGTGGQRITVSGSIERYLRVVTTGTFTAATFAVVVVRNDTAVSF